MYEGQRYEVKTGTSEGLNLRREPTTKGGKTNIILSMPNGTIVTLESVEVRISDGHKWYKVRYIYEDIDKNDEIGWAASDYLLGVGLGGPPPEYTFELSDKKTYSITEVNLKTAVKGNKFSRKSLPLADTQTKIFLDKPFQGTNTYYVSKVNLEKLMSDRTIT